MLRALVVLCFIHNYGILQSATAKGREFSFSQEIIV